MTAQQSINELVADLAIELDRIRTALAQPTVNLAAAESELEAARAAVAASSGDDASLPAVELVKRRREASERLEVAMIEHARLESTAGNERGSHFNRLLELGRSLQSLMSAERSRRASLVRAVLDELMAGGGSKLPALTEMRSPWVASVDSALLSRLRAGEKNAELQLSMLDRALKVLAQPAPEILAPRCK